MAQKTALSVPTMGDVRKNLGYAEDLTTPVPLEEKSLLKIEKNADTFLTKILKGYSVEDLRKQEELVGAVDQLGGDILKEAANQNSVMLARPFRDLSQEKGPGQEIADCLADLTVKASSIDPGKFNPGKKGWALRIAGKVNKKLQKWLLKFYQVGNLIDTIVGALKEGIGKLDRNNKILIDDVMNMKECLLNLSKLLALAKIVDAKLESKINELEDEALKDFLQQEILFAARQKVQEIQELVAVKQQGIITFEMTVRTNKQLIRGVKSTLNVTVPAIRIGTTAFLALSDQKQILEVVKSAKETGSNILARTAKMLKTQKVEIYKEATSGSLDHAKMAEAFDDMFEAVEEAKRFRKEALPVMAQAIREFDVRVEKADQVIADFDKGKKARAAFKDDVE